VRAPHSPRERREAATARRALALVLAVASMVGCVGGCDILGRTKPLSGGYYLEDFEGGARSFSLGGPGRGADAGGVVGGSVQRIGWSQRYVVAYRQPLSLGEASGWMIVDVRSHTVRGPLTDIQFQEACRADSELAAIRVMPARSAWDSY
jgi:hypothetical protein